MRLEGERDEALDAVAEARACFHVGRREDVKSYSLVKSAWNKRQKIDDARLAALTLPHPKDSETPTEGEGK